MDIVIRKNVGPNSEYITIQGALDSLDSLDSLDDSKVVIYLEEGIYNEKVRVLNPNVSIIGTSREKCIISYNDHATKILEDSSKMGTFNSFTMYIGCENFYMENITIENSSGRGQIVGQAVALYVDSNKVHIKNCCLLGHQDTLFTGPIPTDPLPKWINPQFEFSYTNEASEVIFNQLFEDCLIMGDFDFIFGSANAIFQNCEIYSKKNNDYKQCYITAASHVKGGISEYIFKNCKLTGDAKKGSVYLGRPWRPYGRVSFIDCYLGDHIHPNGWHNWDDKKREKTVKYVEVNCSGKGSKSGDRVSWAIIS
ncbi:pectin methylesterase [Thiospirochaeta perfilievii]|uniref:Pectin methylesterase n=1 Tax=Thiospirochaeta perfilievii TaxID=252967 RepID=A0A5C1Q7C3_9SPIO|nr:pectinesterase family protein [Thiospirochaeta perfilievii]QEN03925.1 pectin methylesterase [Thiospirochaeta perfilievii]